MQSQLPGTLALQNWFVRLFNGPAAKLHYRMDHAYYVWRAIFRLTSHKQGQEVTLNNLATAEQSTFSHPDSTYYAGHYSLLADREENQSVHGMMPLGHPGESAVNIIVDFVETADKIPCYDMWDPMSTRKTIHAFTDTQLPPVERLMLVPLSWKGHYVSSKVMAAEGRRSADLG